MDPPPPHLYIYASLDLSFLLTRLAIFFGTSNMVFKIFRPQNLSKSQPDILINFILIKKCVKYILFPI